MGRNPSPYEQRWLERRGTPAASTAPPEPPRNSKGLRTDGPTLEEWVSKGYPADRYPPNDYAMKASAGLAEYQASVKAKAAREAADREAARKAAKAAADAKELAELEELTKPAKPKKPKDE